MKKILLAMADEKILRPLKFKLSKDEYYILLARTGERARELIEAERPAMVVLDSALPGLDGQGMGRGPQETPFKEDAFVVLLAAIDQKRKDPGDLTGGVDDYIFKPVDPGALAERVKALMSRIDLGDGRSALTGLPGRKLVHKELQRRIDWGQTFALCALNLVHFRPYNEVYGFDMGDRAIRGLAKILRTVKQELRPKDFYLGHVGADRYMIMLAPQDVEKYCQVLIQRYQKLRSDLFVRSDFERGYIVTEDKTGRLRRFSLMTLSIGAVTSERRAFTGVQEALKAVRWATLKAATHAGNNYYLRKDGSSELVYAGREKETQKVLVVDDDPVSLRLMRSRLEKEGYQVRTATTGREAMEVIKADPPDLIFLDDTNSQVDGLQAILGLKDRASTADIPLIIVTANAHRERYTGADEYLVKPCSFQYLMRTVHKHLACR